MENYMSYDRFVRLSGRVKALIDVPSNIRDDGKGRKA